MLIELGHNTPPMSSLFPNTKAIYSYEDLVELEESTGAKYELIDRQKNEGCRLYVADVKLRIDKDHIKSDKDTSVYPDVMLACGEETSDLYEENPLLLAEVVSDSTARRDTVTKREKYLKLPSLRAYLILSQTELMMTVYQRQNSEWAHDVFLGKDTEINLPLGNAHDPLKLNLGKIYKYVASRI